MSEYRDLSPRNVILATQRAFLDGDVEAFVGNFAVDAVMEFPHSAELALPSRIQGRDSIRPIFTALQYRYQDDGRRLRRLENLAIHETKDPEVVVVEFEALGDVPSGGSDRRVPDIQVWRVRDGLVVSVRDYLGAVPAAVVRPSVAERIPGSSAWG